MQSSQLVAIIKRLVAMQEDQSAEVQERRFEKDGDLKATVSYDPQAQAFVHRLGHEHSQALNIFQKLPCAHPFV